MGVFGPLIHGSGSTTRRRCAAESPTGKPCQVCLDASNAYNSAHAKTPSGRRTHARNNFARRSAAKDLTHMYPGEYEALRQSYLAEWDRLNPE